MLNIDLDATPRVVKNEVQLSFPKIDAAACSTTHGVEVYVGKVYYLFKSPKLEQFVNPVPPAIPSND